MKNNIAAIRKNKGLSQKQFAEMLGIGNDWLCDIEKGRNNPSLELAKNIADKLNVKISEIFLD